jgi:hypothetical protein
MYVYECSSICVVIGYCPHCRSGFMLLKLFGSFLVNSVSSSLSKFDVPVLKGKFEKIFQYLDVCSCFASFTGRHNIGIIDHILCTMSQLE